MAGALVDNVVHAKHAQEETHHWFGNQEEELTTAAVKVAGYSLRCLHKDTLCLLILISQAHTTLIRGQRVGAVFTSPFGQLGGL